MLPRLTLFPLLPLLLLASPLLAIRAHAAVGPDEVAFNAAEIAPFATHVLKYESTEKMGEFPGPWVPGAWGDGAVARYELVGDAGDGKPAVRMMNVSGPPSLMWKPWTEVSLQRGGWAARIEYRKAGHAAGTFVVDGLPQDRKASVRLTPTGTAFSTVTLPIDVAEGGANARLSFQLYEGVGEGEALFIRSLRLEKVGDLSAAGQAAEAEAAAALSAAARAVAEREAARREAERKPINGWVRPEAKPVKMDKPLEPPPVTGKTYFVAPTGSNEGGDGSEQKPWQTIQHGMNQLHPGDRLYVRGGEYRENMITFARSGRPDAYITVAGYPGEQAKVINSGGMAVFNLDAGSPWTPRRTEELAYVVVRDLHIDAVQGNQAIRLNGPMMLPEYANDVVKSRGIRHNIWVVGCDIVGGGPAEGGLGAGYGAHDVVLSSNRIYNNTSGMMAFLYADGTIIEWNQVYNTCVDQDDAGAIKSMAPGVIIRYNTVYANNRSSTSKKPGWAPDSEGGKQWRFLQGVTGIYLDWAMLTPKGGNNFYPDELKPADPANYVYGNTVYDNNAGIYVYQSSHAKVFANEVYGNGRANSGGWVDGQEGGKWLEFVGPAGYGIAATLSKDVRVYDNIVYDNRLGGLTTESVPGFQAWNNVVFGNDLAQIEVRKGNEGVFAFNTIADAGEQGPPFRHFKEDFSTVEAYRAKYPYKEEGTRLVKLEPGADPLTTAREMIERQPVDEATRTATIGRLTAAALEAGVGVPPAIVPQATFDPTQSLQAPLPWRVPGIVEFENYDVGGPDVSFRDGDAENQGGHYRKDAVDIKASAKAGNGAVVGFTQDGEWLEYTVSTATAGQYELAISYATPEQGRRIRLSLDDTTFAEPGDLPATAGWDDLRTTQPLKVSLPAGDAVIRVTVESGPVDLDRMVLSR